MSIYNCYSKLVKEIDKIRQENTILNGKLADFENQANLKKAQVNAQKQEELNKYLALKDEIEQYQNYIPTDDTRPKNLIEGAPQPANIRILANDVISGDYRKLYSDYTGMLKYIKKEYDQKKVADTNSNFQNQYNAMKQSNEDAIKTMYIDLVNGPIVKQLIYECDCMRNSDTYISNRAVSLDLPSEAAKILKLKIGNKYDEVNKKIWLPFDIPKYDNFIFGYLHNSNQKSADLSVTNVIMAFLLSREKEKPVIHYLDGDRMMSAGLGIFEKMMFTPNSPIKTSPNTSEQMDQRLKEIINHGLYEIDAKLNKTGCLSIYDYNKNHNDFISPQLLILNGFPYGFSRSQNLIAQIVNASKKWGISIVVATDKNMLRNVSDFDSAALPLKNNGLLKIQCDSENYRCRTTPTMLSQSFINRFCPTPKMREIRKDEILNAHLTYNDAKTANTVIQNIIWKYMQVNQGSYRIQFVDGNHYMDGGLGPFMQLLNHSNSPFRKTPKNEDELKTVFRLIHKRGVHIEEELLAQNCRTLAEYNRKAAKPIHPLLVVLDGFPNGYNGCLSAISEMIEFGEKWGLSLVLLGKAFDYNENVKTLLNQMKANDLFESVCDTPQFIQDDLPEINQQFMDVYCPVPKDNKNLVDYYYWNPINTLKSYDRTIIQNGKETRKLLSLPTFINQKDQLTNLSFEYVNKYGKPADVSGFAGYIEGSAGSGKSVLLHSVIANIVSNFHPDDVELWLVDFKMNEFSKYIEHRPPHVKYIILDKSERIIFDMLDKLTDELKIRSQVFKRNGWSSIFDVPKEYHIPRLLVIIDEFEEMVKVLNNPNGSTLTLTYVDKLRSLLAKGRAFGFRFLFSSQNFSSANSFLKDAVNNIPLRIALKNSNSNEMLELLNSKFQFGSDESYELKDMVNGLPPYHSIVGIVNEDGNVESYEQEKNIYLPDGGKRLYTYIDKMKQYFIPVTQETFDVSNNRHYIDKQSQIIDGANLYAYQQTEDECNKITKEEINRGYHLDSEIAVYTGVAQSMNPLQPLWVSKAKYQNFLLVGSDTYRPYMASVAKSIINSFDKEDYEITFLANMNTPLYTVYKETVWKQYRSITDPIKVAEKIEQAVDSIKKRARKKQLFVLCDVAPLVEKVQDELEEMEDRPKSFRSSLHLFGNSTTSEKIEGSDVGMSFEEYKKKLNDNESFDVKKTEMPAHIAEMFKDANENPTFSFKHFESNNTKLDPKSVWGSIHTIIQDGSRFGIHVLNICCKPKDMITGHEAKVAFDEKWYAHKIIYRLDKVTADAISGSIRNAARIGEGESTPDDSISMYIGEDETFTFRPFLHNNIVWGDWYVDDDGNAQII